MSRRQVTVTYSGSTDLDIDEPGIVDNLALVIDGDPTDDQIATAIAADIAFAIDNHGHADLTGGGGDVVPTYHYDRAALIASVRAEIARRRHERHDLAIATIRGALEALDLHPEQRDRIMADIEATAAEVGP